MARVVRFSRSVPPYNAGERAGFSEARAAGLVASGAASYVVADVNTAPVTKDGGASAVEPAPVLIPQPDDDPPEPEPEPEPSPEKPPGLLERMAGTRKKKKTSARKKKTPSK